MFIIISPQLWTGLLIWFFIIILIVGIILLIVSPKFRRRGSGMSTTTFFGSTSEFYDADKMEAIKHVVEEQAGKKMEEQKSDEPNKQE